MSKILLKKQRIILNYLTNFMMDNKDLLLSSYSLITPSVKVATLYLTFIKYYRIITMSYDFEIYMCMSLFNNSALTYFEYTLPNRLKEEGFI